MWPSYFLVVAHGFKVDFGGNGAVGGRAFPGAESTSLYETGSGLHSEDMKAQTIVQRRWGEEGIILGCSIDWNTSKTLIIYLDVVIYDIVVYRV